jgi:ribonuclease HI
LARNKRIFKGKIISPLAVAINAIGQLSEFLSSKKTFTMAGALMRTDEEAWLNKLNLQDFPAPCMIKNISCWQLQYTPQEFTTWLNSQKNHVLSFDGASKGNPGEAGVGGVLFSPRGQRMITYSWNLGITTNNAAEAYALLKGTQIARERQIKKLTIIGDSKTIIRYFVKNTNSKNSALKRTIERIRDTINCMNTYFYHIRRANNWRADDQENKAIGKGKGNLEIKGKSTVPHPPLTPNDPSHTSVHSPNNTHTVRSSVAADMDKLPTFLGGQGTMLNP